MKAIVVHEKGGPECLRIAQVPDPEPGPTDVVVDPEYSGVNFGDVIRRVRGLFPPQQEPPYILGFEGAGPITAIGRDVDSFSIGQRVAFLVESGAYATRVRVPIKQVFEIPNELATSVAGSMVCVGLTAFHLTRLAGLLPGHSVLIHGGAGGVGSLLIQFCKLRDVRVFVTVGSEEKALFAKSLGADVVINRHNEVFQDCVNRETNGAGVDVVFDCVGKAILDGNLKSLRRGGLVLYYGSTSGHPAFPGDKILMNELRIQGFVVFSMWQDPGIWMQGVDGLLSSLASGQLRISLTEFPMNEVSKAHVLLGERRVSGKLVLRMT